jgi:hypothetical protein
MWYGLAGCEPRARGADEDAVSGATPPAPRPGPLHGLRVVEAASLILVPAAAAMLADFGADVVKAEPLEGDQNRRLHGLPALPESPIPYSPCPPVPRSWPIHRRRPPACARC